MAKVALTLLARVDCPLCESLESELLEWDAGRELFALNVVDIESDPALSARYTWRIPVLLHNDEELCAGQLSPKALAHIEAVAC